jgi:hypothetical protein
MIVTCYEMTIGTTCENMGMAINEWQGNMGTLQEHHGDIMKTSLKHMNVMEIWKQLAHVNIFVIHNLVIWKII